jgi:hypothetical protein
MKPTENNEIDLLLRDLARHQGPGSVNRKELSAMHLDADELNSYAEQALPPAARARYTSHLAECATCRKIVSELTSASGANVSEHSVVQKTSAGLGQKFRALFSSGLLRYAAPVLALFAFIVVGLVILREQPQPDFVAQNQPVVAPDATIKTEHASESAASPANIAEPVEDRRSAASETNATKARDNQAKAGEKNETSSIPTATDSVTVTSDGASMGKAAGAVAQPSYAPEPAPPPAAKPQITHTDSRTEVAGRQKEEADKKDEPAREQEGARARTDANQNQVARPAPGTGSLAVQSRDRLQKLESRSAKRAEPKTTYDEADTRTVSGRRFRRQGDVWIDVAYQSSTATTVVSRGSEQFRALVADEPGIRAIAAQLPGEVVVVWKGRAYRIR